MKNSKNVHRSKINSNFCYQGIKSTNCNSGSFHRSTLLWKTFYRQFEKEKIKSFQQNKDNLEERLQLHVSLKKELTWLENDIMTATKSQKRCQ